ncbi:MAG: PLDc N-terminal domain-containing protein [Sumerlaeia bacterium]
MVFGIDFLGGGIIAFIHFIIWAVVMYQIITCPRSLLYKVLWGVGSFVLPCLGPLLWFLFGEKKA